MQTPTACFANGRRESTKSASDHLNHSAPPHQRIQTRAAPARERLLETSVLEMRTYRHDDRLRAHQSQHAAALQTPTHKRLQHTSARAAPTDELVQYASASNTRAGPPYEPLLPRSPGDSMTTSHDDWW